MVLSGVTRPMVGAPPEGASPEGARDLFHAETVATVVRGIRLGMTGDSNDE